jgi:hypothetical protein
MIPANEKWDPSAADRAAASRYGQRSASENWVGPKTVRHEDGWLESACHIYPNLTKVTLKLIDGTLPRELQDDGP